MDQVKTLLNGWDNGTLNPDADQISNIEFLVKEARELGIPGSVEIDKRYRLIRIRKDAEALLEALKKPPPKKSKKKRKTTGSDSENAGGN